MAKRKGGLTFSEEDPIRVARNIDFIRVDVYLHPNFFDPRNPDVRVHGQLHYSGRHRTWRFGVIRFETMSIWDIRQLMYYMRRLIKATKLFRPEDPEVVAHRAHEEEIRRAARVVEQRVRPRPM